MTTAPVLMPFGKHRGQPLGDLPTYYVRHVLGFEDLDPALAEALEDELIRREGPQARRARTEPPEVARLKRRVAELEDDLAAVLEHHGDCYQPRRRGTP